MGLEALRLKNGTRESAYRSLPICARDMDDRRQLLLRMAERGQKQRDACESKLDLVGVKSRQPLEDRVALQRRCCHRPAAPLPPFSPLPELLPGTTRTALPLTTPGSAARCFGRDFFVMRWSTRESVSHSS